MHNPPCLKKFLNYLYNWIFTNIDDEILRVNTKYDSHLYIQNYLI